MIIINYRLETEDLIHYCQYKCIFIKSQIDLIIDFDHIFI